MIHDNGAPFRFARGNRALEQAMIVGNVGVVAVGDLAGVVDQIAVRKKGMAPAPLLQEQKRLVRFMARSRRKTPTRRRARSSHNRAVRDQLRPGPVRVHHKPAPRPGVLFGCHAVCGREHNRPLRRALNPNPPIIRNVHTGHQPHDRPFLHPQQRIGRHEQTTCHTNARIGSPNVRAAQGARDSRPRRARLDVDRLVRLKIRDLRVIADGSAVRRPWQKTVPMPAQQAKGIRLESWRAHPAVGPALIIRVVHRPRHYRNFQVLRIILRGHDFQMRAGEFGRRRTNRGIRCPFDQPALRVPAV